MCLACFVCASSLVRAGRVVSHAEQVAKELQKEQQQLLQDPSVPPLLKTGVGIPLNSFTARCLLFSCLGSIGPSWDCKLPVSPMFLPIGSLGFMPPLLFWYSPIALWPCAFLLLFLRLWLPILLLHSLLLLHLVLLLDLLMLCLSLLLCVAAARSYATAAPVIATVCSFAAAGAVVGFMGLDRLAYVQRLLPARQHKRETFSRRRLRLLTRVESSTPPPAGGAAATAAAPATATATGTAPAPAVADGVVGTSGLILSVRDEGAPGAPGAPLNPAAGESQGSSAADALVASGGAPSNSNSSSKCRKNNRLPDTAQTSLVAVPCTLAPVALATRDERAADRLAAAQRLLPLVQQRETDLLEQQQDAAGEELVHEGRRQLLAAVSSVAAALGPPLTPTEAAAAAVATGETFRRPRHRTRDGTSQTQRETRKETARVASPHVSRQLLSMLAHERSLALGEGLSLCVCACLPFVSSCSFSSSVRRLTLCLPLLSPPVLATFLQ